MQNGKSKQYSLHRILAKAFIPNPDNKPEVDHINTNRTDCRLENLRWVTHAENMRNPLSQQSIKSNSKTHEALRKSIKTKIERKRKTVPKRVYQFSINREFIAEYESAREASRVTGLTAMTIAEVSRGGLRGRQSCGGYLWSRSKDIIPVYEPYKKKHKPICNILKIGYSLKDGILLKKPAKLLG